MAKVLFGTSPYAVTSPTQESISAATPDDLRKIYAQRFRPDGALLVAVGDFDADKMLAQVKANFAAWKSMGEGAMAEVPHPSAAPEHAAFFVPRAGSVQTTIELAAFGPLRSDPDYEAAEVANAIYGGMFGSRLVRNIREDKGYTYSPFASLSPFKNAGVMATQADVRNAVTAASLNEIMYELNRMATTSPTKQELTTARRYLIGLEAIRMQRRASIASQLASLWVNGLPPDEIGNHGKKVAKVTAEDVDAAGRKYFPASRTAIVAVGEEGVIKDAIAPFNLKLQPAP
jgi:predicted Zn-dependent peptidase